MALPGNEEITILSGSISGIVTNAINTEDCNNGSINLDISNPDGPFYIEWSNGALTEEISDLIPGEYCVTVTDNLCGEARGCWEVKCCPFILEEEQIEYNISNSACEENFGELELIISDVDTDDFPLNIYVENQTDNTKYVFEITTNISNFTDLSEGIYTAQLNYGEGCTYHFEFEIELKAIEIQFDKTASCDNDGSIQVNVFEGESPYTYAWSDDDTQSGNFRSGLNSKFYTVTVSDVNLCTASSTTFIKDSDPIVTDGMSVFIGKSECDDNTGVLEINTGPQGGSAPYTYEWSNGESGKLIENLEGGSYQLTITGAEGCTISIEYTVPVDGQAIIINSSVSNTCAGLNTGIVAVLATPVGNGVLEYAWSNGGTEFLIEDLATGIYTVTITDQSNECSLEASYEVEDWGLEPMVISTNIKNNCESDGNANGEIALGASGGLNPYEIIWNNGQTSFTISNLQAGEYMATITDDCGNAEYFSHNLVSDQISIDIEVIYPNFEEFIISALASGGNAPYEYEWNTGANTFFLDEVEEGTYTVTVTDQSGCSKSESIDAICDPVNFQFVTNFITADCTSPFTMIFDPSQNYGQGPFSVKVEKKINQEYEIVDFRLLQTKEELLDYIYQDGDTGNFRVTATNYCGYSKTEDFSGCVDCDYYFSNNDDTYFASVMGDLIFLELVCPCDNDCGFLGFTTDKIKIILNQYELDVFSEVSGYATLEVNWPTGPSSYIYYSNNQDQYIISGPSEYILTDDEFESGISVSISMSLPPGMEEVCDITVPIEFGQQGYNGYFHKWDNARLDPFYSHDPPYNWGTRACFYDCEIPTVNGVLYDNEPIDTNDEFNNYNDMCTSESIWAPQYFLYEPNNYANPCDGGGYLLSHYETVVGIVSGAITIPPNVAIDAHPNWPGQMMEEINPSFPYTCPPHEWDKGYCLFDSKNVYGPEVQLRDPIIASYCEGRFFDPPLDTDGDGIPDELDPCPLNPDVFCDGNDNGGGGTVGGGGTDENGCQTTFFPNECRLAIVCPDEDVIYVDGVVENESYSGEEPCIHCFSADVCRVTHPETGEEYSEIVGPISGSVDITVGNIPECGNVCAIIFTCSITGEWWYLCSADCGTSGNPVCGYNQLDDIASLLMDEGGTQSIEMELTKELALEIIKSNSESRRPNYKHNDNELATIPNPSDEGFVVKYESDRAFRTNLIIRNTYEAVVYEMEVQIDEGLNQFAIEQEFISGIYIISINNHQQIISTKHVIQK